MNQRNTIATTASFITNVKNLVKKFNMKINRSDPVLEQIYSQIVGHDPAVDKGVRPLNVRV